MKLCKFLDNGQERIGVIDGNTVFAVDGDATAFSPILAGDVDMAKAKSATGVPLAETRLLPPLADGARVFCVGRNYADHAAEMGGPPPADPNIFSRGHRSFVGHDAVLRMPAVSRNYDFEGELAVVIGRAGKSIPEESALGHVAGYTIVMDGSVRDYQQHSLLAGKNFDQSGACGPFIVPADEIPDPQNLSIETRLNGDTVQSSRTNHMIFTVARLISYLSDILELQTGDLISTGTPEGVGAGRTPPLWMKPGDQIEVTVGSIGTLSNRVAES